MGPDDAATRLLGEFERDALFLTSDMGMDQRIRPMMLRVMKDLTQILGAAETSLCSGSIAHASHPADDDPFGGDTSPAPYQYDFLVVTDKLLVTTWGHFDVEAEEIAPETTTVRTTSKITGVTQHTQAGMPRRGGSIATHHEVHLAFADGSGEDLPGTEDELSPAGCERMSELLPALYASMAK